MRQASHVHLSNPSTQLSSNTGNLRVPFGLRDGRMLSPRQVPPGLRCGCICPACHAPLVAKATDSEHRRPHFAHQHDSNCKAGYETSLHKKAKQILEEHAQILLPSWDGEEGMPNPAVLADNTGHLWTGRRVRFLKRKVQLTDVRLEERQGDYIPDVIAKDLQGELLIEIRVSHAVDALKRRRIQAEGKRLVEINLSSLTPDVLAHEEQLVNSVLFDPTNRHWLSCPDATEDWRQAYRELKAQVDLRNNEIANERRRLEESRAAQHEKRMRLQQSLRAPYVALLDALPSLVSFERIDSLLTQYQARDQALAEKLIEQIAPLEVQSAIRFVEIGSWIYKVHPSLWQAASYHHFILGQPEWSEFNQRDLAKWVMQRFGKEEELYKLFMKQYIARSEARSKGYRKNRISFWAFTDGENGAIPNFYQPINAFVERLICLGVLEPVKGVKGGVRIAHAVK